MKEENKKFVIGQEVWVIERECDGTTDVAGFLFLAESKGCIIASSWINDYDFDETIEYHIQETSENYDTALHVYPIEDCFDTREEAEKALRGE